MKPSDFLTELSNEKLAQYKTAASADASKADKAGDFKKGNKRFSGIVKATNKQFANDAKSGVSKGILAELDMFAPRTVYFKMADGNYIKADYRGSEGLTGHKANDNVTFTGMSWVPVNTARSLGLDKFLAKGSDPSTTVSQNAQNIVGTSSAGEGPLGNRTIDVVDFVNGKEDAVPSALKTKVMQWVQKNTPQQQQGVAESQHSESCPHCGGEMVSEELMNEKKDACYYKVKSRYKVWPSAYASGALVKCRKKGADSWGNGGKKNESSILEGINRADESLHDWFNKEKWVRMDTKGNIKGPCAKEPGEGKPKCLPQSKAHSLGKKGRASAAARKRREDPNPDRSGKAINVNTKKEK